MAETYVALIRGINVGRAKRVAMADLRDVLQALGHRDVRTLLNSGNVIFTSGRTSPAGIASGIEDAVLTRSGVAARVLVLTRAEFATVVEENPLRKVASDPTRLLVAVCKDAEKLREIKRLEREDWGEEALGSGRVAAYLWCAKGILASQLTVAVGRALGESATTRNLATILKIEASLRGASTDEGGRRGPTRRRISGAAGE